MTAGVLSLVGVLLGVLLTKALDAWSDQRNARRRYRESREGCRKRLESIQLAVSAGGQPEAVNANKVIADEIWNLGSELDTYSNAIADPRVHSSKQDDDFIATLRRVVVLHQLPTN
jgi:hypothetical protein